jgi:hypothetical protein
MSMPTALSAAAPMMINAASQGSMIAYAGRAATTLPQQRADTLCVTSRDLAEARAVSR